MADNADPSACSVQITELRNCWHKSAVHEWWLCLYLRIPAIVEGYHQTLAIAA